jgi:hypothetical protein
MNRIDQPREIAEAVLCLLASGSCPLLTGEAIAFDGGIGGLLYDPASRGVYAN